MSKIVQMPSSVVEFRALANKCIEEDDLLQAIVYLNSALRLSINPIQVKEIKLDLARLYSLKYKFAYANELLFQVLEIDHDSKEAMMLLMFNYLSLNDRESALYYYTKAKDYIEKRKYNNLKELKEMFEAEGEDVTASDIFVDAINSEIDLEKILQGEKGPGTFTMINDTYRFNSKIDKVCEALKKENYSEAIDLANEALKFNVSKDKKALAYYSKGLCLLNMGYAKETKEIAIKSLKEDPGNVEMQLLLCESLEQLNDKDGIEDALEPLLAIAPSEFQQFRRIMQIFIENKKWDEAKKFLNSRMLDFPDSYSHYEYLGIIYYNSGDKKSALSAFKKMYGFYGDLCNAMNYINYINSDINKPIKVESIFGDWPDLNFKYMTYLYTFLVLKDDEFVAKVLKESDELFRVIKWLAQGCRAKPLFEIITEICCALSQSKKEIKKLRLFQQRLLGLLCTYSFVDPIVKMHIAFEISYAGLESSLPIVADNKFYVATLNYEPDTKNIGQTLIDAYYMSCAIAMVSSQENFEKVSKVATKINNVSHRAELRWKSSGAVVAVIIELALNKKLKDIAPHIRYSEDTKKRYYNQLLNEISIDKILEN